VAASGDYYVTVPDSLANNFNSDTLTLATVDINATASIIDLTCNGDDDGEIDITATGGLAPYTYLWSNSATDEDLTGLTAGLYTVTISDSIGCSDIFEFILTEPLPIVIVPAITHVTCQGGADGAVDISVSGGGGGFTYEWTGGSTAEDQTGLAAGSYTVTATDMNGCAVSGTFTVADGILLAPPVISGASQLCPGDSSLLDAGSGYNSYQWSDGSTLQSITAFTGVYSVTVSNLAGCTSNSGDFTVSAFASPVVTITPSGTPAFCEGGSITLTATAGFSAYLWSAGETTDQITVSINDTYTVTVTDANGCTATASLEVTVFTIPFLDIISLSDVLCKDDANGVIEVAGNGGAAPYLYSMNNGAFSSTSSFTSLVPGLYEITVQDDNGCTSMTQFFINEPADYLSASYNTVDVLCYGGSTGEISLTVSGGTVPYTYEWSNAATDENITGLVAGPYTVTVTDAYGCQLLFAIDILEPTQIVVGQDYTNISCFGGSDGTAIVFVSGGVPDYDYAWDTNPVQTDFVAFDLDAGVHEVTITDVNGCVVTSSFLISEPSELDVISSVSDVSCYGFANGSATVTGSGGTPYLSGAPYIYSWNTIPVQSTSTATGLAAGSYTASVTDSTGCIIYANISVDEPNQLTITVSSTDVTCNGGNNGESTVIVSGGSPGYSYNWNTVPVQTTLTATGLSAGLYTVTVTDANGCMASVNALINQPLPLSLNAGIVNVTCNGNANGQVQLNVSGGNAPYSYFWNTSPSKTTANLLNVTAGSYTVIVTDNKGCTASSTFTVTQPAPIMANETVDNAGCFGDNDGSISLNVTGGTLPYSYIWSNGQTVSSISSLVAGSYMVTITDASGCTLVKAIVVTQPADLTLQPIISHASCNGASDGSIIVNVSGGTPSYDYLWSNGATVSQVSGLQAGNYTVTVTDVSGCTKKGTFTVNAPAALTCICNSNVVNVSCFGGSNGSITVQPNGGTAPYSYLWSNGQVTQSISGLTAGTYTVTITDANGCQVVGVVSITQPQLLFVFATSANITCNGAANGTANAITNGGTPPYSYSWNTVPVQTAQTATGLSPGTFTVTVTDSKGCTAFSTATISQPNAINCSASSTNITCNGSANGTASVTASGGTGPYTYQWNTVPVKTTTTIIGLGTGTYTVTITDAAGCTKTCQTTVSQPSSLVALYVPVNVLCNGSATGVIDLIVTGGTAPYTYSWSNGTTTQDQQGLQAGVYTVTVSDNKGCNLSAVIAITQPAPLVCNASSSNISCNGGTDGSATVSVNGGVAPYQYLWSEGNTTSSTSGLAVGTYTVTVSDLNSCSTVCTVTITEPPVLSCTINTCCDTILCYGQLTGGLDVHVSGGSPPYAYSWNTVPVQTTAVASGLGAGSYTVTVTDSKGCTTSCSYQLTQPDELTCTTLGSNATCYGGSDGTAMVFATGGTPPYQYAWNTLVTQTTSTATGLSAGNYTVFVTDANGCTTSCTVLITQPASITLNMTITHVTCSGAQDGSASVSGSGGSSPYSYLWSTGETTSSISGLTGATYTVTVTDAGGCSATATAVINEPTAISCAVSSTYATCFGGSNGSLTVTASGGTGTLSYSWNTLPPQLSATATGLAAGTYVVTVTDANGCTSTCSGTVTQPGQLSCTIDVIKHVTCNGGSDGSATVTATGGTGVYTYSWNTAPVQTNATAENLIAGNYSVTVTDANGCSTTCTVTINQPEPLLCSASSTGTNCGNADGTATVTATGGTPLYSYLWSDGQTTITATGLAEGDYTVSVTDANACTTTCLVNVGSSSNLIATISSTPVTCNGGSDGSATVNVAGGDPPYTYSWNTVPAQTTSTATGLAAGTYTVIVSDTKGCSITRTVSVNEPSPVVPSFSGVTHVSCFGGSNGSATVNATGGLPPYTFLWSGGQTTQTVSGLTAGTYTVTVTDFSQCAATASVTLTQPGSPLSISETHTSVICQGQNNGSIDITVTGGTPPYTYIWNNGSTTEDLSGLGGGNYTVTVTDANLCSATLSVVLAEPVLLSCTVTGTKPTCFNGNDGTATVSVAGGDAPYNYLWSNGQTTVSATGLQAGTYTVVVTDANGCTTSCETTISNPAALLLEVEKDKDASCFGAQDGTAEALPSGGTSPYTYLWSNGQTTKIATGLGAGTYTVTVTDAAGCTKSGSVTISEPPPLVVSLVKVNATCNDGNDGTATSTVTGGTPSYTYSWNTVPVQTTGTATGLSKGVYTITVTDANGCTKSASITVSQPSAINISITKTNATCNGVADGTATASVSGGVGPYSYSWNTVPVQTSSVATGLSAGTYTLTVTDSKGCTKSKSVTITQGQGISVGFTKVVHVACFGGSNGTLEANPSGGTGSYSYLWSNGQTIQFITGLAAGTYTVTVSDGAGCSKTGSIAITQPAALSCSIAKTDAGCNGGAGGTATVTASGGTAPYNYLWNTVPSKTTASVTGLTAGTYQVVVTDSKGCTTSCSVTILQQSAITVGFTKVVHVSCNGGSNGTAEANPSGGSPGYSYLWSNGKTVAFITGLSAGTYTVTVTDSQGCTSSASKTITQPPALNVTSTKVNISCKNGNNGSINITPSGGTPPYFYLWNNGVTTEDRSSLTAGTYTVIVTDQKACSKSVTVIINQPPALTLSVAVNKTISCFGGNNGKLTAAAGGGVAPYSYSWNTVPVKTTASISGLTAGSYTVTITDAKGCVKSSTKTLSQPPVLNLTVSQTNVTVAGGNNGTATANPSGGDSPYTFIWNTSPVKTTKKVTGLTAGAYTVTVTDSKGCTKSASVIITEPASCQSFKSYTKTAWAATPSGNNGGAYLQNNFSNAFPNGLVIGQCGREIRLLSSNAVDAFLLSSGTPRKLNSGILTNPTANSYGNSLASHLVALRLNIVFDSSNPSFAPTSSTLFSELVIASGPFTGWTVQQLYNEANYRIGCGGVSSYYYSCLNTAISNINASWNNGSNCNSFLVCPGTPLRPVLTDLTEESTDEIAVAVYPNPSNGLINLQFSIEEQVPYTLQVIDLTGRMVYTESSITEAGFNGKHYDFNDFPKGVYVFQVNIDGRVKTSRIVIQ